MRAAVPGGQPEWWVRALAALPLPLLYAITGLLALAARALRWRGQVVRENLAAAFPDWSEAQLRATTHAYYRGFGQVLAEIVKGAAMPATELAGRVVLENPGIVHEPLARGRAVLLLAAHQCNWEWMLLALAVQLGYPLEAVYKPLVNPWAEREMHLIRTRFGSRLIPVQDFLADVLRRRDVVRALAMVADQEPVGSEHRCWLRFLNRDSAFFAGPDDLARAMHLPVFFIGMQRTGRGRYRIRFTPLASADEELGRGALVERYARLVESQIRAAPSDWPWSHKRWKLRKPLYGKS